MDLGIAGKNALVTGGSRGLGRQCAVSLAAEGVNVAICGRTQGTIDGTVAELESMGVKAFGVVADVIDASDMQRLHDETVSGLGPIDILVNNAGGSIGSTDIDGTPLDNFRTVFDLNPVRRLRADQTCLATHAGSGLGSHHQYRVDLGSRVRR